VPLKFKYGYIDKVETEIEGSIEAYLGSRVHEALEKLYKDLKFEKENSLQELLDYFNSEWEKHWNENILIVREEYTKENFRKMGASARLPNTTAGTILSGREGLSGLEMRIVIS